MVVISKDFKVLHKVKFEAIKVDDSTKIHRLGNLQDESDELITTPLQDVPKIYKSIERNASLRKMKALELISRDSIRNIVSNLINFQYDLEATLLLRMNDPPMCNERVTDIPLPLVLEPKFNDAENEILTGGKDQDEDSEPCMSIVIDVGSYIEMEYGDVHNLECEISGNFPFAINESLKKEHRFEVRARVLHMLLKYYGQDLFRLFGGYESPDVSNGSIFIEAACAGLSRYWESKNTLKEHKLGIEALTIGADILFSIEEVPLLRAYSMLRCIGEAFEARGDLKKGAKLFWEMHEYFTEEMLEGWSRGDDEYIEEEESILHTLWRASWLYLCADEFDRSELAHVHAWHYWKMIKGYMDLKVVQNCLLLYYKSEELQNNTEVDDGSKKKVNVIFRALVKRAGILDGEDNYQIHDMIEAVPYRMLKPSSRKKAKAKKHLLRLADTLNVDHFRELLLEAYNSAEDQDPFVDSTKYEGINKYLTAADKTKKDFKKKNASSITCQVCHKEENEYKPDIKISFQCECKSFYYCSQTCQLIHWGTHRHFCPLKIESDAADFSFKNCRKCSKPYFICNDDDIKKSAQCPYQPNIVNYCSKQCKRDDWKVHEPEHSRAKMSKNGKQRVHDERINLYFGRGDYVDSRSPEQMASMWGV